MPGSFHMLAYDLAGDKSARLFSDIVPWLIALVVIVLVGGVAIYVLRRWLRSEDGGSEGFTLQDLRDLHKAGEISDDEFQRAKAQMIGRLKAPANADSAAETDASPGNSDM